MPGKHVIKIPGIFYHMLVILTHVPQDRSTQDGSPAIAVSRMGMNLERGGGTLGSIRMELSKRFLSPSGPRHLKPQKPRNPQHNPLGKVCRGNGAFHRR